MENQEQRPMYFTALEIENITCFGEKQKLSLLNPDGTLSQWTLILGDNGVGKTTLLKCLAWMRPVEETDKEKAKVDDILVALKPVMDDFEGESAYEKIIKIGPADVRARVAANFAVDVELNAVPFEGSIISHGLVLETKQRKLDKITQEYASLSNFNTISMYAYGASRHMGLKNFDLPELKDPVNNLFSELGDLYDASQVLMNLEFASLKELRDEGKAGRATAFFEKVRIILKDLLPDIHSSSAIHINSPLDDKGSQTQQLIDIDTPYGQVPLDALSLGYKTMLAWGVDLALRMIWRNPELDEPLKAPAVVIVDEIDLHLHPKWQRILREFLLFHFPRTQFISTAHSPFMAQSSETENLCVLRREENAHEVCIENNPELIRGWRIGQIITSDLFGIESERSPEVEALREERREILDRNASLPGDDARLKVIDAELAELPVLENGDDQALLDQIRKSAELLRQEGKLL